MDSNTVSDLFSRPGQDPRQWFSYGVVDDDQEDQKAVVFDPSYGPLVSVTLQPSAVPVRCRVASWCGGNGEAEYAPFVSGDEVLVAVPEGDERAGCIILSRANNEIDAFPTTVGGQDTTKNAVAFRRLRCPYVIESAESILVRAATAGNFVLLSKEGNVTVSDGTKGFLHVGADFVGLQASDGDGAPTMLFQLDKTNGVATVEVPGQGKLTISKDGTAQWVAAGAIAISAGGMSASEHVATVEGVVNLIASSLMGLSTLSAPGALSTLANPGIAAALVVAGIPIAATNVNFVPLAAPLAAALSAKAPNVTGKAPGVGCPALLAG